MPPRLFSLLSLIEAALGGGLSAGGVMRSADYRRGVARMTFADGGGCIRLQNFLLADGQLCVRVDLFRSGVNEPGSTSIYPQPGGFDWSTEAARVASSWHALEPTIDGEASVSA